MSHLADLTAHIQDYLFPMFYFSLEVLPSTHLPLVVFSLLTCAIVIFPRAMLNLSLESISLTFCQITHFSRWISPEFFFQHKSGISSCHGKKGSYLPIRTQDFPRADSQCKPLSGLALPYVQKKQSKAITEHVANLQRFPSLAADDVTCHWCEYCKLVLQTFRGFGAFLKSPGCCVRIAT